MNRALRRTLLVACFGMLALLGLVAPAAAAVDVASSALAGNGAPTSPWVGWETATSWEPETEYFFRKGYYAYTVSPNFLKTGIALRGEAGTVLQFNGAGNAVVFDNPGGTAHPYSDWTQNVRFENFIIQGTARATNGLFLRAVRNGIFRHISVRDVANAGVWGEALVTNIFDNIRVTHHEMPNDQFNVVPAYGIVLGPRGAGDDTTTTVVTNAVIEGVSQAGIWIKAGSFANTFIGGTSEGNAGKGMVIDGHTNSVIGMDFEANGGTNLEINDANNQIQGVISVGPIDVKNGYLNKLRGRFSNVAVSTAADYTDLSGSMITAALADQSATTIKFGMFVVSGFRGDAFVGNVLDSVVPLTVANGTITTDARLSKLFSVVVVADTALANPTNAVDGQLVTWRIQQDSVGGHAIVFGSMFESQGGEPISNPGVFGSNPLARGSAGVGLNPAPFSYTEITARYNAPAQKWRIQ
ncbi:MAG: hypothetical protein ACXWG3_17300 [Usitatibacter sp.]